MDARERLIETGYECFVENGLDFPMSEIAKRANVSAGLPFYYFPTKKDYIAAMYESCYMELQDVPKGFAWIREAEGEITFYDYLSASWLDFWSMVNWNLENWTKFQFMQLIDVTESFADVMPTEDNQFTEMEETFELGASVGIEKEYIAIDVPFDYVVAAQRAYVDLATKYLHAHPDLQTSSEFKKKIWLNHWYGNGGVHVDEETLEKLFNEYPE